MAHVVVLKVRAEDAPAEFAHVGDDETGAMVCPGDVMRGLGVVDHPDEGKGVRTTADEEEEERTDW